MTSSISGVALLCVSFLVVVVGVINGFQLFLEFIRNVATALLLCWVEYLLLLIFPSCSCYRYTPSFVSNIVYASLGEIVNFHVVTVPLSIMYCVSTSILTIPLFLLYHVQNCALIPI